MLNRDKGVLAALIALAGYVWARDRSWAAAPGDTLPILAALPLFVWLKRPWTFTGGRSVFEPRTLLAGAVLFMSGLLCDSELVLAGGWTLILASWLAARTATGIDASTRRLLILPLLSFPWIATDLQGAGWWFRLSGAWAAEKTLAFGRFDVARQGTELTVNGFPLTVAPACSGINGLEAMLIAGAVMAWLAFRGSRLFWWNLPVLVAAAWIANTLRIVFAGLCGVALRATRYEDWFGALHLIAGWLALCAMFVLCRSLFTFESRLAPRCSNALKKELTGGGSLAWLILVYCVWRCDDLFSAWRHSPYDRFGWFAFLVWLLPAEFARRERGRFAPWRSNSRALLSAGVALVFLGDLGDFNLFRDAGLASVLMGFGAGRFSPAWAAGALAWLPASGWAGSLLGVHPVLFSCARVLLAGATVAWLTRRAVKGDAAAPTAMLNPGGGFESTR